MDMGRNNGIMGRMSEGKVNERLKELSHANCGFDWLNKIYKYLQRN